MWRSNVMPMETLHLPPSSSTSRFVTDFLLFVYFPLSLPVSHSLSPSVSLFLSFSFSVLSFFSHILHILMAANLSSIYQGKKTLVEKSNYTLTAINRAAAGDYKCSLTDNEALESSQRVNVSCEFSWHVHRLSILYHNKKINPPNVVLNLPLPWANKWPLFPNYPKYPFYIDWNFLTSYI